VGLFATLFGTFLGVALAFVAERRLQAERDALERAKALADEERRLNHVRALLRDEVTHNGNGLQHLTEALSKTHPARTDGWAWVRAVVESFEFGWYRELLQTFHARWTTAATNQRTSSIETW
jgi:hypothetical protein